MKQIDSQAHNIRRKNNEAEKRSLVIGIKPTDQYKSL